MLVFDPLEKDANGFSYDDIMIHPITAAAEAALWKKRRGHAAKTLWFGMQGEVRGLAPWPVGAGVGWSTHGRRTRRRQVADTAQGDQW